MSEPLSLFPLTDDEREARRRGAQTPLMRQYWKIKDRHPGAILLFRMGDFYETFEEDAEIVARVLGITLTKRGNGAAEDIPLAGFPHHALDTHLPKLVRAGYRVAVCEQLEDPKLARKVVRRDVVEVVTPGVSFHDGLLAPKESRYLAAVVWGTTRQDAGWVGFSFLDASTGEFQATEVPEDRLDDLLTTVGPAELLVDKRQRDRARALRASGFVLTPQEDWVFGEAFARETLLRHFRTHSLKGFGVDDLRLGLVAAGAALHYLGETQKGRVPHVRRLRRYRSDDHMVLDPQTRRNLELVASMQGGREGSLVQILDQTQTAMGGRLLRQWLVRPLRDVERIRRRLDAVEALARSERLRRTVRDALRPVGDLERLTARACTGRATPRDLVALRVSLAQIPVLREALAAEETAALRTLREELDPLEDLTTAVGRALVDEPPARLEAGGYIRPGYHEELDELRRLARGGKETLARIQAQEAQRTGITSLKVAYNKVFGYYLEVTNAHRDKVPPTWIRKQTLVNAERYVTEELKRFEEQILTAEEKMLALEARLFGELRQTVAEAVEPLQRNARLLATLDVFAALAEVAERHGYVRPEVDDGMLLEIVEGRHPVVEQTLPPGEAFVPNSVTLDPAGEAGAQLLLVTGPNMAGKSVVLRQTGLIVLLAQVGSFVPARRARIGVVDKIFTRVGAQDNLAAGESTFLVEMHETANILHNATPRSLVLLDEVGRGTSTFDGLSIAWALVEYLHDTPEVAARTLFATHYHELNALAERLPRVRSARILVQEHEGRVVFLRTLVPGAADHSYGIEVARMAGLPEPVIRRAREVLAHLEAHDVAEEIGRPGAAAGLPSARRADPTAVGPPTPALAPAPPADPVARRVLDALAKVDPERMAPIEALLKLAELKQLVAPLGDGPQRS